MQFPNSFKILLLVCIKSSWLHLSVGQGEEPPAADASAAAQDQGPNQAQDPLTEGSENSNTPEAILYETPEKTGNSLAYSEHSAGFNDVTNLLILNSLSAAALLCARGVYILYNEPDYSSNAEDDVVIFAGKDLDTCVAPGAMRSLLQAQNNIDIMEDSLSIFNEERFVALPIEAHAKMDYQYEHNTARLSKLKEVNSFILMGKEGWSVQTAAAEYCVKPGIEGEYPICPVASAKKLFGSDLNWVAVKRGCQGTPINVELKYCFEYGNELQANSDNSTEPEEIVPEAPAAEEEATGGGLEEAPPAPGEPVASGDTDVQETGLFGQCETEIDEFAALVRIRLTHDFYSTYQIQFPLNKAHSWKTAILDTTIDIVRHCTIDPFPATKVLYFVRELYIYFAEKHVWSQGGGWPLKPKRRVSLVVHETQRCLDRMKAKNWGSVTKTLSGTIVGSLQEPTIPDKTIDPDFKTKKGYDIIMEFVWLSINFVGAACHAALEFETDFWMDYMNVAYDMYLQPMEEFWGNSEKAMLYYPIIFGGYSLKRQYRSLAAVTSALYATTKIDKLPRPITLDTQ